MNFKRHLRIHKVKCSYCDKQFARKAVLLQHERIHTASGAEKKPYQCSNCDKAFTIKDNLIIHQRIHTGTGDYPYLCSQCDKIFARKDALLKHERIHTGKKAYQCSQCDKRFAIKDDLITHERMHTGEKQYHCIHCSKGFARKDALLKHQRIHTGKKTYQCSYCDKQFARKIAMLRHIRIHTEDKSYRCCHCDKHFPHNDALLHHKKIHNEKQYQCSHCDKCFADKGTLARHQKIHTGEKPYQCSHCELCFAQKYNLVKHQRAHIVETPYPLVYMESLLDNDPSDKKDFKTSDLKNDISSNNEILCSAPSSEYSCNVEAEKCSNKCEDNTSYTNLGEEETNIIENTEQSDETHFKAKDLEKDILSNNESTEHSDEPDFKDKDLEKDISSNNENTDQSDETDFKAKDLETDISSNNENTEQSDEIDFKAKALEKDISSNNEILCSTPSSEYSCKESVNAEKFPNKYDNTNYKQLDEEEPKIENTEQSEKNYFKINDLKKDFSSDNESLCSTSFSANSYKESLETEKCSNKNNDNTSYKHLGEKEPKRKENTLGLIDIKDLTSQFSKVMKQKIQSKKRRSLYTFDSSEVFDSAPPPVDDLPCEGYPIDNPHIKVKKKKVVEEPVNPHINQKYNKKKREEITNPFLEVKSIDKIQEKYYQELKSKDGSTSTVKKMKKVHSAKSLHSLYKYNVGDMYEGPPIEEPKVLQLTESPHKIVQRQLERQLESKTKGNIKDS